jgi:hypothetical protein
MRIKKEESNERLAYKMPFYKQKQTSLWNEKDVIVLRRRQKSVERVRLQKERDRQTEKKKRDRDSSSKRLTRKRKLHELERCKYRQFF